MRIARDAEVEFDEFARACDLVEEYFGTTLEGVALEAPVSRRQLVAVLARAQLTGRQRALEGFEHGTEVVFQSTDETILWFDGGLWAELGDLHHLEGDEVRAAREVHRRILAAFDDATGVDDRDPFVLVERFDVYA